MFKCASGERSSELDVAFGWGSLDNARALLEHHWDTWITRADFEYLSSIGIKYKGYSAQLGRSFLVDPTKVRRNPILNDCRKVLKECE